MELKDQNWSHLGRKKKNVKEKEKRRGRGRRGRSQDQASQVMELWIFGMETNLDHGIEWIHGTLRLCMINSMFPNLGFSLNCILSLDFLKLRWVKPTRNKISKEFPFLFGFIVK